MQNYRLSIRWIESGVLSFAMLLFHAAKVEAVDTLPCRVVVTDAQSGWPVPLIELRTTHNVRFVTDNAGIIAMDDPSLMNREVWFRVIGHGYDVPVDGFGSRGVRLTPRPGESLRIEVHRSSIAKRIGRITGSGLFVESQKLGEETEWHDAPVFGCDSVQNAVHGGKLFWAWGDTRVPFNRLGIFHMTSATTSLRPFPTLKPPLRPKWDYFVDDRGKPKPVAKMPGKGPTWLTGYVNVPAANGTEKLVAFYRKITPPMKTYEVGLCVWNDVSEQFDHLRTIWKESDGAPLPTPVVDGQPAFWTDDDGHRWLLFGNPLPHVRVPATYEAWKDSSKWQALSPQETLISAEDATEVQPHSGSIAWNEYRRRWVTVFMQTLGKPSAFGTVWYAEAASPLGPWGPAVKVLSHDNYTFYNPRLHPEITEPGEPVLLFEGTYASTFAANPLPTPRYNYNQILYRLDLDDAALQNASRTRE